MPTVPVVGVGKDGRKVIGPWGYLNRKLPFIELPLRLLALCRPILGSERHRYAIAWLDKLGTSPMAHHGSNGNRSGKREGGVESRK